MESLYKSERWKSLEGIDRAQLLLVLEGLKRGTFIGGNMHSFLDILKETGLEYRLNTDKYPLRPVFTIGRPEDLLEESRRYLALPGNASSDEYHRISGWFLNYPACCTEEYVRERTPEERKIKRGGKTSHLRYKFGRELDYKIKANGSYPDILDYRPPSFTPCGIECPEATKLLSTWKEAIDRLDPEAGEELVELHRNDFPEELVHMEYLRGKRQKRISEYLPKMLSGEI